MKSLSVTGVIEQPKALPVVGCSALVRPLWIITTIISVSVLILGLSVLRLQNRVIKMEQTNPSNRGTVTPTQQ